MQLHLSWNRTEKMGITVKELVESSNLTSLPSNYAFSTNNFTSPRHDLMNITDHQQQVPVIDFSLLTSGSPNQRSQIIQDLKYACLEWGFFMVINHGVHESLREEMLNLVQKFFDLSSDEKSEFAGNHLLDPIRCGTSFNASVEKVFFWRDFLKVFVHPDFHSPSKPQGFSEISYEFCKRIREVARELLRAMSESLGLENGYIEKTLNMESGLQILIANLYPPCPQPELAMGLPPHSDHGLLTLLIQNEIGGLQIMHKGKWVAVNSLPNSFLVNTGDHMEVLSNGRYKSVVHRAVVNNKATRISLAVANGPSLDTIVTPALELVDENNPPIYHGMSYREFIELQQGNQLDGKSCLDRIRVLNM